MNLSLIVFLRSDIFTYIMAEAREPDKITYRTMNWNDPLILQRIIEERFANSLDQTITHDEVWSKYFTPNIKGISTKDYIVSRIIPRPRDIVYFCSQALSHAINHSNPIINEEDILQAEQDYSGHAYSSLLAELEAQFEGTANLLIEFAGVSDIITLAELEIIVKRAKISEDNFDKIVDLLYDYTFLGIETAPDTFTFLYDPDRKDVFKRLGQRTGELRGIIRFKINPAFHKYFEIQSNTF